MIRVTIVTEERQDKDITPDWINQQINRRRREGAPVWVRIVIEQNGLNMALSTPSCPRTGGGGRPPSVEEKRVFNLWSKLHLDADDFTGGNLVVFLRQVMH